MVNDAFGEEIWTDEIDGVSGSPTVTHTYGGPGLEAGMYYQFRVTSFRDTNDGRVSISTTEDLKGSSSWSNTPLQLTETVGNRAPESRSILSITSIQVIY